MLAKNLGHEATDVWVNGKYKPPHYLLVREVYCYYLVLILPTIWFLVLVMGLKEISMIIVD